MITFGLLKHVHLCYIKAFLVQLAHFDDQTLSSQIILHTITDYFGCRGIWLYNRSGYQKWFGCSIVWALRCSSWRRCDVCAQVSLLLWGFLSSCKPMRELPSNETLINSANMHLSTAGAFAFSMVYCISSYEHLLWQVQGPLFSEHLFSQMIQLLSPTYSHQCWVRVRSPPLHLTVVFSYMHMTIRRLHKWSENQCTGCP